MIGWIVMATLGYLAGALLLFRFWSMPKYRKKFLERYQAWQKEYSRGYGGRYSMPKLVSHVAVAVGLALAWPGFALYRTLWPKGIDYKFEKEKLKEKIKQEREAAVKEAERIAKEFGLNNPKD